MAGVKGRSGGARKNSGGARRGAGRPPKEGKTATVPVEADGKDVLDLLMDIAFGRIEASTVQVRAAIAAVQYTHAKVGEGGKKEIKQDAAKEASEGRFRPSAPPALKIVN